MSKEHAYAYEAGYRDGSINYELEHCPACKNVANLQEALAENAKLRNEVDNLLDFEHLTSVAVAYAGCDECGEYKQTMLRLFTESAKLRELLLDYDKMLAIAADELGYQSRGLRMDSVLNALRIRMSEMGVETDR